MSSTPFKVKAVYEYSSPHDDDLNFPNGQIITVTEEEDADWYVGEYTDSQGNNVSGLFPKNFVERYEPEVPSRPTRPSRPKSSVQSPPLAAAEFGGHEEAEETAPPPLPVQSKPAPAPASAPLSAPEPAPIPEPVPAAHKEPQPPAKEEARAVQTTVDTPPKPKPVGAKGPPPPVAGKSNAFKDRIAAFNKQDVPVMPFKPGGSPANYAVKKPFVAPPPSRNAYVPPPKAEPVHKIYRRDEDPEIAERIAEDQAAAESAGFSTAQDSAPREAEAEEDAPKPQSLKERIALLQKQQAEQAQKRADAASKEKPKRPTKKRTESSEQVPADEAHLDEEQALPIRASQDSTDQARAAANRVSSPIMSPTIVREPDILSDGNEADQSAAGETTEANEESSDQDEPQPRRSIPEPVRPPRAPTAPTQEPDVGEEEDTTEGQSEEEEDEVDEETRRRMELRERMAKLSGGMGMAGMFGPQPGMAIAPPSKKTSKPKERRQSEESPVSPPPRPMIPVPGMMPPAAAARTENTEPAVEKEEETAGVITDEHGADQVPDVEDIKPPPPPAKESRKSLDAGRGAPPPIPGDRPVPVPPPTSSRPMPPAPPARVPQSPGEEAPRRRRSSVETPRGIAPPVPTNRGSIDTTRSPPIPPPHQSSYFGTDTQSEASMSGGAEPRPSRAAPPPIPGMPLGSPQLQSRAPPPPPPAAAPPVVEEPDEGESEYEGDYDTDIASSEKHKAALKTHARQPSLDDSTTADDTPVSHSSPPPAMSPSTSHRAVPPPLPGQASRGKVSSEIPRAAPPPIPPSRPPPTDEDEGDGFDNYKRYQESTRAAPPPPPTTAPAPIPSLQQDTAQDSSDDLYQVPTKKSVEVPRTAPPLPSEASPRPPDAARMGGGRQSLDVNRTLSRKSMDAPRPSGEGFIASDIDLDESSQWWTQPNTPPPEFQNRNDVLFEVEESSTSRRGGHTTISKDVYVLFMDYSQTVVTARFDRANPADVSLEQRHEAPPPRMRQDQLETAWQTFGSKIAEQASSLTSSKKDSSALGDGSPFALALELLRAQPSALLPVGTRAYGALVYANIGNASVQQHDEIRPGDMVTFRNAKLQGKHGGLHQKYSLDVGTGMQGHVAVVVEWDGTKKKVRTVEQGRDEKGRVKVRAESYRLGDLKSGEVRVWRVVGRGWVGWDEGGK
ncbi:hypothetical protein K461DRAFT_328347 [Myriangium duriaei CBS 260.36]|uniref:SH3 domain-containing protein n=1 Tax=Myriangium duriaei CBS 260.36 TaxID=1168546 RepID=A0A9P4IY34_9PEZI|nr:hypothetical protein K461DRAFT_328347 [Myriangium duriaei CBS 260.36]